MLTNTTVTPTSDLEVDDDMPGDVTVTELSETSMTVEWVFDSWRGGGRLVWAFDWDRPPDVVAPGAVASFDARGELRKTNLSSTFALTGALVGPESQLHLSNSEIREETGVITDQETFQFTTRELDLVEQGRQKPVQYVNLRFRHLGFRDETTIVRWEYRLSESGEHDDEGPTTATPPSTDGKQTTTLPAPGSVVDSGLLDAKCEINQEQFDREWKRYSDFDDRIPVAERSHEAKQYNRLATEISELAVESFALQAEMEVDRQMRLELRDYRAKLVQNQKTNLLKAFWRLSYVTYSTIKTGNDLGRTYEKAFTSVDSFSRLGHSVKVVKGLTPPTSPKPTTTTEQVETHVKELGISAALDLLTSDSPTDYGVSVFNSMQKEAGKAVFPTADITDEEITILRTQHLEKRVIDDILQESYRKNSDRRQRVEAIHVKIVTKGEELEQWEQAEKERVARELQAACEADGGE